MTEEQRKKYTSKILGKDASDCDNCTETDGKELSVSIIDANPENVPKFMLRDIWKRAGVILENYEVITMEKSTHCVSEYDKCYSVNVGSKNTKCMCRHFVATCGICPHVIAVLEKRDDLKPYLDRFRANKKKVSQIAFGNVFSRAGQKPGTKKKKRQKQCN